MKAKVYIDGQSGTTGLQIYDRIGLRHDLELLRIAEEKRHDIEERRRFLNSADIVFLCLPDEGAREAVSLIENPEVRVIDASTAHRTAEGWTYGFPELFPGQREKIAQSKRVANPGCHASGFLAVTVPLTASGILPADYPVSCMSLTGYSGGGKKMIAQYEQGERPLELSSPGLYALGLTHKHLPEMKKYSGLQFDPVFVPVVDDFAQGMVTSILLENRLLKGSPTAEEIHGVIEHYYGGSGFVSVKPYAEKQPTLYANALAGSNKMEITVCGNSEQTAVIACFDNLGKGASGAAVQNMNIMLGIDERCGLE